MRPRYTSSVIHSSLAKVKRAFKKIATPILIAGIFSSCNNPSKHTDNETEEIGSPFKRSGIYVTPYSGKISKDGNGYHMKDRIILVFRGPQSDSEVQSMIIPFNGKITGKLGKVNVWEVQIEGDLDHAIVSIKKNPKIISASKNYFAITAGKKLDNQTYFGDGSNGLWWSEKIQLAEAYSLIEEQKIELRPTTVAILDSSFDLSLEDLNRKYSPTQYHLDIGDIDSNVSNTDMWGWILNYSLIFHGTSTACLIGCENNGKQVNGVSHHAKILPIKIISANLLREAAVQNIADPIFGDDFRIAAALVYVNELRQDLNITTVNMSLSFEPGIFMPPVAMRIAINLLYSNGITVIVSAGNENLDASQRYPAAFPEVIAVGATKQIGATNVSNGWEEKADFSNFSSMQNEISLVAPGVEIAIVQRIPDALIPFSELLGDAFNGQILDLPVVASKLIEDVVNNRFTEFISLSNGTSFSAPMVAGAAALLKSINPDLSPNEIKTVLVDTGDEVDWMNGATIKRLNVKKAVEEVLRGMGKLAGHGAEVDVGEVPNNTPFRVEEKEETRCCVDVFEVTGTSVSITDGGYPLHVRTYDDQLGSPVFSTVARVSHGEEGVYFITANQRESLDDVRRNPTALVRKIPGIPNDAVPFYLTGDDPQSEKFLYINQGTMYSVDVLGNPLDIDYGLEISDIQEMHIINRKILIRANGPEGRKVYALFATVHNNVISLEFLYTLPDGFNLNTAGFHADLFYQQSAQCISYCTLSLPSDCFTNCNETPIIAMGNYEHVSFVNGDFSATTPGPFDPRTLYAIHGTPYNLDIRDLGMAREVSRDVTAVDKLGGQFIRGGSSAWAIEGFDGQTIHITKFFEHPDLKGIEGQFIVAGQKIVFCGYVPEQQMPCIPQ